MEEVLKELKLINDRISRVEAKCVEIDIVKEQLEAHSNEEKKINEKILDFDKELKAVEMRVMKTQVIPDIGYSNSQCQDVSLPSSSNDANNRSDNIQLGNLNENIAVEEGT